MATITGFIEKIKFRNEENGYTIMTVIDQSDGDEVVMVGTVSYAAEGDMIQATGRMTEHPVYGEQLQIESYELKNPEDAASMERYLGSGAINRNIIYYIKSLSLFRVIVLLSFNIFPTPIKMFSQ